MSDKKKLTVSQVAKFLEINPHTIRYYDKEGLISSEIDAKSGYRLFDYEDIYRLSNIMLLRDSDISIKNIRNLIRNYNKELYKEYLDMSANNIDKKILDLKKQKSRIENNLESLKFKEDEFAIKEYNKRMLKIINIKDFDGDYSLSELYRDVKNKKINNLIYESIYYNFSEDKIIYCVKSKSDFDIQLDKGTYLEYKCCIKNDRIIMSKINEFIEYAYKNKLNIAENLYMKISPDATLVVDTGYFATLFSKITS